MSSSEWPDLSRLAALAREQNLDARPLLLRVQTDLFVAAPARDRATVAAFEALAMGFLPIVDDATAAVVARKLAPLADTPLAILDALIRRGGEVRNAVLAERHDMAQPPPPPLLQDRRPATQVEQAEVFGEAPDDDLDLALARDVDIPLNSGLLRRLVDRGREHPQLALALLERHDLGAGDEAVLYLHADHARRTQIRERLTAFVAVTGRRPSIARAEREEIEWLLGFARSLDTTAFEAQLARMLHLAPAPMWRFQLEPRRELLALALVAAGIAPEDCIQAFLIFHPAISRSVETVFHLAKIARSVTRPVAIHLIEAVLDVTIEAKREARYVPAADPSPMLVRDRAMRPTVAQIRANVLARRAG